MFLFSIGFFFLGEFVNFNAIGSFDEVYSKGLEVMDLTAFTLCKENNLPIIVFDMNKKGNLQNLLMGEKVGTLVVA